ncbi:MAG: hypothetical protein KBT27_05210 [Prevotellaceae bacterium]|nr:hypothetical protein [Candidatus Faecinaster equi]
MKNRLFSFCRKLTGVLCVLSISGLMYSCSDDYDLPDTKPDWLGSSIYDYLKNDGHYKNMVKLIDSLDYAEVLSRTGSKTLFVADDDAYTRFYANNPWGVKCFEDMTKAQWEQLLYTSMLDNSYLLEMLPNVTSGTGRSVDLNQCMRRENALSATSTVSYIRWDSMVDNRLVIPKTLSTSDKDYWARFREQSKGGLYLANDGTVPMMMHWIDGFMEEKRITNEDFATIMGRSRQPGDVYIYDSKVIEQDITCQNGYVNKLDRVLLAPTNMAEMIRTSGKTNIFSHMLDRFSAPFYNRTLTEKYQELNQNVDSVFEKRYLSKYSQGGKDLGSDPEGSKVSYYLSYDPGWNSFHNTSHSVNSDMGAMFVPCDDALKNYFKKGGGGEFLMEAYAPGIEVTDENLLECIDMVPIDVIQALINNLMKESFIETVPSKYITIMNDARDPMFSNFETEEVYKSKIDTTLIANNGVVYVLNEVYTPAKYASVSAPALVGKNLHIFNWAITADDRYINDPNNAPLNAFISTYLLAMKSHFSFFIPTDDALKAYVDPVSFAQSQPYAIEFGFDTKNKTKPVTSKKHKYDPKTGEIDPTPMTGVFDTDGKITNNRLKDMLDMHIIVHNEGVEGDSTCIIANKEYYITKGGVPIKVTNGLLNENGMKVQGSWQIDKNEDCNVIEFYDKSKEGNGKTYVIDKPIQSTTKSVYSVLFDDGNEVSPFSEFYKLCSVNPKIIEDAGFLVDENGKELSGKQYTKELNKYLIFYTDDPCLDENVRFFNTYRYTVYVPTNEAILKVIAEKKLPTWETIERYIEERQNYIRQREEGGASESEIELLTKQYQQHAQVMITCLLNFVKYHFQDNSIFNDKCKIDENKYETACINSKTNRYNTVTVSSNASGQLQVADNDGNTCHVIPSRCNILTRDYVFNKAGESATQIETSSSAVLHQIDGVLNFTSLDGKTYEDIYNDTSKSKSFMKKYRIIK